MKTDNKAVTGACNAKRVKMHSFELKSDGSVERVGRFGSYGPILEASTKSEAMRRFMAFAYRACEHSPKVKLSNGAYQLAHETLHGIGIESGVEGRDLPLCLTGVKTWDDVNDSKASFDYYASAEYRSAMVV